jgi:hypothetical protein
MTFIIGVKDKRRVVDYRRVKRITIFTILYLPVYNAFTSCDTKILWINTLYKK